MREPDSWEPPEDTPRCSSCGEPMVIVEAGQTRHPNCDPEATPTIEKNTISDSEHEHR
jgi:hypothetical protein